MIQHYTTITYTLPVKCNSFKLGNIPSNNIAESDKALYDKFNIYVYMCNEHVVHIR